MTNGTFRLTLSRSHEVHGLGAIGEDSADTIYNTDRNLW